MMTLKQLADQYRQSADKLKKREEKIKKQIKKGELKNDIDVQMRIRLLQDERYDAIKTANYLETYYSHREREKNA